MVLYQGALTLVGCTVGAFRLVLLASGLIQRREPMNLPMADSAELSISSLAR